ncbi:MAG: hypothetical protein JKY37_13300 [Nannocystaceae bacterium]|nr:hypothetical protein [Nannocystaceae bacterium]
MGGRLQRGTVVRHGGGREQRERVDRHRSPGPLRAHPISVLEADGDGDSCVARGDRGIEGELGAGTWDIVVDTWSDGGDTFVGEYLFVVLPCQPGVEACAGAL